MKLIGTRWWRCSRIVFVADPEKTHVYDRAKRGSVQLTSAIGSLRYDLWYKYRRV
jgi:hypothetical protein